MVVNPTGTCSLLSWASLILAKYCGFSTYGVLKVKVQRGEGAALLHPQSDTTGGSYGDAGLPGRKSSHGQLALHLTTHQL